MTHSRLHLSDRQNEISELCRLERLVMAAGMGTVWLGGDVVSRATGSVITAIQPQAAESAKFCTCTQEQDKFHALR